MDGRAGGVRFRARSRRCSQAIARTSSWACSTATSRDRWCDGLAGYDRLRVVVNACTRLRFCTADDTMELNEKRDPSQTPAGFAPWFEHPTRKSASSTVVCGHWSTLELMLAPNVLMLDSGCLWGGTLTAISLPDRRVYQVPSRAPVQPKPFG